MHRRCWSGTIAVWFLAAACGPPALKSDPRYPLFQEAVQKYRAGDTAAAQTLFASGLSAAATAHDARDQARFHSGLGLCHMARHQYGRALDEFNASLNWARQDRGNPRQNDLCSSAAINIATVYARMHDYANAIRASGEALAFQPGPAQSALLRLNLAVYHSQAGQDDLAQHAFADVIQQARQSNDRQTLGRALHSHFFVLLRQGQIAAASQALEESTATRQALGDPELADNEVALAHLRLAQKRYADALAALDRYAASGRNLYWTGEVQHLRGRIEAEAGQRGRALAAFRLAIESARRQRVHIRPAEQFVLSSETKLAEIYASFIATAMDIYQNEPNQELLAESLAAAEEIRVFGQRSAFLSADRWGEMAPAGYQDALLELDRLYAASAGQQANIARVKLRLLSFEAQMARDEPLLMPPPTNPRTYLRELQTAAGANEAIFVFHISRAASLLWMIRREGVEVRRIPQAEQLPAHIDAFTNSLKAKALASPQAGENLLRQIFGEFYPAAATKEYWTFVLDGPLFEVPFALLPLPGAPGTVAAERFSISLMPSFFPVRSARRAGAKLLFAGLGDPVYNGADPRYQGAPPDPPAELARLAGSATEVRQAAGLWRQRGYDARVLLGPEASSRNLRQLLDQRPGVVHVATHVGVHPDTANPYLALSLQNGRPDEFGPQSLSAFRLPGTLVMMAGCGSGRGAVAPGVGLQGLTRAWLLAGADAVVASFWPVSDDAGELAGEFYQRLAGLSKQGSDEEVSPGARRRAGARALQQAMLQVRQAGRTPMATWAAYYLMGRN